MHRILAALAIFVLSVAPAAPADAQTIISLINYDAARAGLRLGYGGRGLDLQGSVDSRRFANLVRFRADVGHGNWLGINSNGNEPRVTRAAASALFYFAPAHQPDFPAYVGVGVGAFVPHADDFPTRMGARLILGMEGYADRWTVGVELEFDFTSGKPLDGFPNKDLLPTARVGIAIRRRF
jgi:hypothetical protein